MISMETLTKPYEEETCQLMLEKWKEMKWYYFLKTK